MCHEGVAKKFLKREIITPQKKRGLRNFPDGLVVKTSPSNKAGSSLIPNWGDKIPQASVAKKAKLKTSAIL